MFEGEEEKLAKMVDCADQSKLQALVEAIIERHTCRCYHGSFVSPCHDCNTRRFIAEFLAEQKRGYSDGPQYDPELGGMDGPGNVT